MEKIITEWTQKWWWILTILLLLGVYVYGYHKMYFHQDDLDWMIMANRSFFSVMSLPIGDHINYVFRWLFKLEWNFFHFNFPAYFLVSVLMHGLVVWFLYLLAKATSGRRDLASMAALLFTINMNWSETVLWISGQTISITAIFVLLAMLAIWQKKHEVLTLFLASWTSALALGLLGATILIFKKLRWKTIGLILFVVLLYALKGTDGTQLQVSWEWATQVIMVWGLMMINSVVGRLVIPFERFEMIRIILIGLSTLGILYYFRTRLLNVWRDNWSRFLILQTSIYYLIVAGGRAQYGVGIMRADRYGYLGLILFLLFLVRILRNSKIGKWIWVVPIILIMQCYGLYAKASLYVARPQELRALVNEITKTNKNNINQEEYLPHFVLNDERLRYKDLLMLMGD